MIKTKFSQGSGKAHAFEKCKAWMKKYGGYK